MVHTAGYLQSVRKTVPSRITSNQISPRNTSDPWIPYWTYTRKSQRKKGKGKKKDTKRGKNGKNERKTKQTKNMRSGRRPNPEDKVAACLAVLAGTISPVL